MEPEVQAEKPVAATTADDLPASDESPEKPKSAESAPAVTDTDEPVTRGVRSRIDELTRNRREAERERDYWRQEAERLRAVPKPEPVVEKEPKTAADFGFDDAKYQQYLIDTIKTEAKQSAVEAAKAELREAQEREAALIRRADYDDRADEFSKSVPDYAEVALKDPENGGPVITQTMAETIIDSENGPAIAYHLGKNTRLAAEISRLTPLQQAREIGRIEAKLAEKPHVPKVSEAPAPAPKLDATEPAVEKTWADMSDAEFAKWRRKSIARKR